MAKNNRGVAFTQTQTWMVGGAASHVDSRSCYGCGGLGHLLRDYPDKNHEDKGAIFRKGDGEWRASRNSNATTEQTPAKPTAAKRKEKKKAEGKTDDSFINVGTVEVDDILILYLTQTSFAQFQRYKTLLVEEVEERDGRYCHD